jgi:EAL domain-containing protein (putative c-di-GMP-specific phosphodiesterase class I)
MAAQLTDSWIVSTAHDRLPRDLRMLDRAMSEAAGVKHNGDGSGDARRILDIAGSHEPLDLVLDEIARLVERQVPGSLCSIVFDQAHAASKGYTVVSRKPQTHENGLLALARGVNGTSELLSAHVMAVHSSGCEPPGELTLYYTAPPQSSNSPAIEMAMSLAAIAIRHRELWSDLNRQAVRQSAEAAPERAPAQQIETDLRNALRNGELQLFYQPQVGLNHQLVAMEALIRWNHPKMGMLLPDRFIPIAEETGLIEPIGGWVVAEACRQCAGWNKEFRTPVKVCVNISAPQLYLSDLTRVVAASLDRYGLAPSCLEIELTESVAMRNREHSARTLQNLRNLGVSIALDDFGTGYSSLSYLQALPVDVLKIDKSFLKHIDAHAAAAVVEAIASLGRSLGLRIVAEGVETLDQMARIQAIGIDVAQGYLIARPMPASGAFAWMEAVRSASAST